MENKSKKKELISVVVPCFNEQEALPIFYDELVKVMKDLKSYEYELILVDDGSSDSTLKEMEKLAKKDKKVKYISFSRNFGKEAAMYAGFRNTKGDYVCTMDADMQDPPYLLKDMLKILKSEDYDCVATRRVSRTGESKIRSFFARMFYKIINKISDADIVDGARDYRLMKRPMVDSIISICEYNRFSKGIFGWVGYKTYWLPYENVQRVAGQTSWSFWGLFKYAIDGIINFSNAPLQIASVFGFIMTFVAFISLLFVIVRKIVYGDPVAGWASTISIIIFIGGIQLFCLGVMGQYIGKTYLETKNRPHYIVARTNIKNNK